MIDDDVKLGKDVRIFNRDLVNIFGCEIGDNTFIGPFVEITRGVVIGKNCNIASHSYICDSVFIEDDVFIGHGVMFTNNLFPKVGRYRTFKKTVVRKGASVGTNTTIISGVVIGEHAFVGAGLHGACGAVSHHPNARLRHAGRGWRDPRQGRATGLRW